MKSILFIATVLLWTVAFSQDLSGSLGAYLKVKEALIKGNSELAGVNAKALLDSITVTKSLKELTPEAQKLASASTLDAQRLAFAEISPKLWEAIAKADVGGLPVYYQYCPMKKAYWLSEEKAIKNPYFGAQMLTCGSTVDQK